MDKKTAQSLARVAGAEARRAMRQMKVPGFPKPYFISYLLRDEERWTLKSLNENFTLKRQAIPCVAYTTFAEFGGAKYDGVLLLSRAVPGSTVRLERKQTREGRKLAVTTVVELLEYERK